MSQTNAAALSTETAAIKRSQEYYFGMLPDSGVYHIARDGETLCRIDLYEKSRWYKRGSEQLIPPEQRLCHFCDGAFHRELALSKAQIREELVALAGATRDSAGSFSKRELAELLAAFRAVVPGSG